MLGSVSAPPVAGSTEAFVTIDGRRMRYLQTSSPAALSMPAVLDAPLVLVHGMMSYSFAWRFNIESLSRLAPVYAPDLLNLGYSEHVRGLPADLASTADYLCRFLDRIGVASAHLLGASHGGAVATVMAARAPQRVKSLSLVAPANPWSRTSDQLIRFYQTPLGRLFAHTLPYFPLSLQRWRFGTMYGDPSRVRPGSFEGYASSWRIPGTTAHAMEVVRNWQDDMQLLEHCIGQLAMPVLVICGDRDPVVSPASVRALAERIPHARFRVIPDGGHLPYEEFPEEFNAMVEGTLREFQE